MNPNPVEVGPSTQHVCATCGKPTEATHSCKMCGKTFCTEHQHQLALSHTGGMNIVFACEQCIIDHKLYVIDINHPFYLKYGGHK